MKEHDTYTGDKIMDWIFEEYWTNKWIVTYYGVHWTRDVDGNVKYLLVL